MTITPESRAAKIIADYYATDLDVINGSDGEKRTIESLIAAAIREAENAKLEEAAKRLTARILDFEDSDDAESETTAADVVIMELRQIRDDIRSLKDTTP